MSEVSVIVPTFNRPELLRRALQSLQAQTFRDFEVVVANDAGTDVSALVESFSPFFRVQYVSATSNGGLAATRNLALKHAHGALIAYLDDDDEYLPEHLQVLRDFWHSVPNQVVYSDAYRTSYYRSASGELKVIKRKVPFSKPFSLETLLVENLAPVNCFLHHRECLEKVGIFDVGLYTHEDWDFWIRMGLVYPFAHVSKVTSNVSFIYGGGSMTATRKMSFEHSRLLLYRRYAQASSSMPGVLEGQKRAEERIYQNYAPAIDLFDPEKRVKDRIFTFFDEMMKPEHKLVAQLSESLCKEYKLARRYPWLLTFRKLVLGILSLFKKKYRYHTIYD